MDIKLLCRSYIEKGLFKKYLETSAMLPKNDIGYNVPYSLPFYLRNSTSCAHGLVNFLNFLEETPVSLKNLRMSHDISFPHFPYSSSGTFYYFLRDAELFPDQAASIGGVFENDPVAWIELTSQEQYEFAQVILEYQPEELCSTRLIEWLKDEGFNNPSTYAQRAAELISKDKAAAFKEFVMHGRFIESQLLFWQFPEEKMAEILRELALQEQCITTYDYVWFLMKKKSETAARHLLLADLTKSIFGRTDIPEPKTMEEVGDFISAQKGWQELMFFHISRAAELEPETIELQEKLLKMYPAVPESFDAQETILLAQRVLAAKPESVVAHDVLNSLQKNR
ncbi:hypothetical protein FJ366_01765 [Candidatus Dependentiae bacterium]|nr:hypothetical protein [Candidatus Dependentiae bacterium]